VITPLLTTATCSRFRRRHRKPSYSSEYEAGFLNGIREASRQGYLGFGRQISARVYGLAYILLVIRVLPEEEFGEFRTYPGVVSCRLGLATAFALNPLLKFAAEEETDQAQVITASMILNLAFNLIASLLIVLFRTPFSNLLNSRAFAPLMLYLPRCLRLLLSDFALMLLQTRFLIQRVF